MAPSVAEFFQDKSVLVTGATGFLGKALIEKLLRSCPGITTIYLLTRPKKNLSAQQRIRELWNNKIFERLREKEPDSFKKLKLIAGDILEKDLGISNDDRQELQRCCNIVFHGAACVRFDQKLKDAIEMNTKGTLRLLELAEKMNNLLAFVHLSTAYCRCKVDVLEEKMYPPVHDPEKVMDLVDWLDDETLAYLEPKLISSEPNTYSYTKAITENLVAKYTSKFPVGIGRLSIVTAAYKEPIPGWVDNLNGPTGILIGGGKGVLRTMLCNENYQADLYPVDMAVNGCILLSYVCGLEKSKEVKVCNMTQSRRNPLTWKESLDAGRKIINEYPFSVCLWYPGGSIKKCKLYHKIHAFFAHLIPAYLVDFLMILLGKKTFMVKLQKRINDGLEVFHHYTIKEWCFKNDYFRSFSKRISEEDNEIFYTDTLLYKWDDYIRNYILGAREFCCNEDISTLPYARKLNRRLFYLDIAVKTIVILFLIYLFYVCCGLFS
ncbi:putative fatty acyl-CoA reductase CG5065 [Nymphalis io]|uniref:putative fatty acyl-CoA reductase CG5065 n=1 Tax=Inachis io TaxID=171585 RepID=UPI002169F362|nr:putative fatty acyl-CoA reductase CG5065 [Nymphalis io]